MATLTKVEMPELHCEMVEEGYEGSGRWACWNGYLI